MTNIGLLPMTQGLDVPPTDPRPLGLEFPMGPRHFEPFDLHNPSYLLPTHLDGMYAAGSATRPSANDAQSFDFSTLVPPPSMGLFDPHHAGVDFTTATATARNITTSNAMSRKRGHPPVPSVEEQNKCRKSGQHLVDRQLGDQAVDLRSVAVTSNASVPVAGQGLTNITMHPIPIPLFDRPEGMSRDEYACM